MLSAYLASATTTTTKKEERKRANHLTIITLQKPLCVWMYYDILFYDFIRKEKTKLCPSISTIDYFYMCDTDKNGYFDELTITRIYK